MSDKQTSHDEDIDVEDIIEKVNNSMTENNTPVQNNDNDIKREKARAIAKNITVQRRQSNAPHESSSDTHNRKALSREDFLPVKQEPVSKGKIVLVAVLAGLLSMLLTFYFYGMYKTSGRFLPGTYINGGDVGGMTKQEATKLISSVQSSIIPSKIDIKKFGGSQVSVPLSKIGYSDNIKDSVSSFFDDQNHFLWFINYFGKQELNMNVEYSFDYNALDDELRRRVIDTSIKDVSKNAYIDKNGQNFVVVEAVQGSKVRADKEAELLDYIKKQIADGIVNIDISKLDCYDKPDVYASSLKSTCDSLNKLKDIKIVYDFDYKKHVIKGSTVADWIIVGEDSIGAYDVDSDKAMAYVEKLAEIYDSYEKDRTFKSTSRGTILVKQGDGCYGWWIDQQQTCNALIEAVKKMKSANLKPIYYVSTATGYKYVGNPKTRTEKTDIGNTYMEIDLKKQHFWYYEGGKKKFESDIVSGRSGNETSTPAGVYCLWDKQGSYSDGQWSVSYWSNIGTNGVGIGYSASQKKFGGSEYATSGTDGIILMPESAAKYVYTKIAKGTPCVIYK